MIEIAAGKDVAANRLRLSAIVAEELAIRTFGWPRDRVMKRDFTGFSKRWMIEK